MFASMMKLVWNAYEYMQMYSADDIFLTKKSIGQGLKDISPALETLIVFPEKIKKSILKKKSADNNKSNKTNTACEELKRNFTVII